MNEKTSNQQQDSIKNFSRKINEISNTKLNNEFMVIARIESFILGKGIEDALTRAKAYVNAGANGIMIHSKEKLLKQIFNFSDKFRKSS